MSGLQELDEVEHDVYVEYSLMPHREHSTVALKLFCRVSTKILSRVDHVLTHNSAVAATCPNGHRGVRGPFNAAYINDTDTFGEGSVPNQQPKVSMLDDLRVRLSN